VGLAAGEFDGECHWCWGWVGGGKRAVPSAQQGVAWRMGGGWHAAAAAGSVIAAVHGTASIRGCVVYGTASIRNCIVNGTASMRGCVGVVCGCVVCAVAVAAVASVLEGGREHGRDRGSCDCKTDECVCVCACVCDAYECVWLTGLILSVICRL